jgi:hypothetical protein
MLGATVVPFGLLALGVVIVAWRLYNPRVALLALLALAASPTIMPMASLVMVETFLALWVLLIYTALALVIERPSATTGLFLGAALGLAFLTKLTIPLILSGAFLYAGYAYFRRHEFDARFARMAACVVLPLVVLAGPWYIKNGGVAVQHAIMSSAFNKSNLGGESIPAGERLVAMAEQICGWIMLPTLIVGLWAHFGARSSTTEQQDSSHASTADGLGRSFIKVAASGFTLGAIVLLVPSYFESRFLLPAWPAMAIVIAAGLEHFGLPGRSWRRAVPQVVLLSALGWSINIFCNQHCWVTYWSLEGVMQQLVRDHGVKTLGLLGNTGDWNFFKFRLINDLRLEREDHAAAQRPLEITDFSRRSRDDLARGLDETDAFAMLNSEQLPAEWVRDAPLLNRAYADIDREFSNVVGRFMEVEADQHVPPRFHVYVRRPGSEPACPAPRSDGASR